MNKQLPVALTPFEICAGWFYWAAMLFVMPVVLPVIVDRIGLSVNHAQLNFIFYCVNFLITTVLLGRFCLQSLKMGFHRPVYTFQTAALGFAGIQSSNVLFNILVALLKPDFANLNDSNIQTMVTENYGIMVIGTVFLVPVVEELLFRGVIFGCLRSRSRVAAYIVSAAIFSGVHLLNYITSYDALTLVLSFLQYLPAGLCLGWAYARSGSIFAPILIHMTVNQIGILSMR